MENRACYILVLIFLTKNVYTELTYLEDNDLILDKDGIFQSHQVVKSAVVMNSITDDKKPNTSDVVQQNLNNTSLDSKNIITAESLTNYNQVHLIDSLKSHTPLVVKNIIVLHVREKIKEMQVQMKRCDNLTEIPYELRQHFLDCGNAHMNKSVEMVEGLIESLIQTKQLIKIAKDKFAECKNKKDEFIKNQKEKEAQNQKDDEEREDEENNETNSANNAERKRRSLHSLSRQKRARTRNQRSTTPKPTRIGNFLKKAGKFAQTSSEMWSKYGCYVLAGTEMALNATIIVFDLATNIYQGYDLVRYMDQKIGRCMLATFDEYMLKNCRGKYLPIEKDDRRK